MKCPNCIIELHDDKIFLFCEKCERHFIGISMPGDDGTLKNALIHISSESLYELEDMKNQLNLSPVAGAIQCKMPAEKFAALERKTQMRETVIVDGVKRFKANRIVRFLLDTNPIIDMNKIAGMQSAGTFTKAELKEFYQLIGYSVDGYKDIFGDEE